VIWLEFAVVLAAILIGGRVGGIGLGTTGAIGLAILVFGFGLPPSSPPVTVLAIVVAVVTAAACLQASGGMDLLVELAKKALALRPGWITIVAPIVAYVFTFCSGTGHVAYAILPVIADTAKSAGVRPERPLAVSVIASQQAITASPLSAATAGLLGLLASAGLEVDGRPIELWHILVVAVPATFVGCLVAAIVQCFIGRDLADDPLAQERMRKAVGKAQTNDPTDRVQDAAPTPPPLEGRARSRAIAAIAIFLGAGALIVAFGMLPGLRPTFTELRTPDGIVTVDEIDAALTDLADPERADVPIPREVLARELASLKDRAPEIVATTVGMPTLIQIVMYSAAGLMLLVCGARPAVAISTPVALAGVVAFLSIMGLGWLGNAFFDGNREVVIGAVSGVVEAHPWVFALGLFALSVVLFSQASTVAALVPVGIALGLPPSTLIACFPAVNGYFFLPTYGTIVAAAAFDTTGTTRLGSWVLDHSFQIPGLVATASAVSIGWLIASVVL
jgi:anaerobic C4-dicarboxylate transporter DcuA